MSTRVEIADGKTAEVSVVPVESTNLGETWIDEDIPRGQRVISILNGDSHEYLIAGDLDAFHAKLTAELYPERPREELVEILAQLQVPASYNLEAEQIIREAAEDEDPMGYIIDDANKILESREIARARAHWILDAGWRPPR